MSTETIINFKGTKELKKAIKDAAFYAGKSNSSEFIRDVLKSNKDVKKYLLLSKS